MSLESDYNKKHAKAVEKYLQQIRQKYLQVIKVVSKMGSKADLNAGNAFFFKNNDNINKQINNLLEGLYSNVSQITVSGINSQWDLAVEKNNEVAKIAFGKSLAELPAQFKNKYLSGTDTARKAFFDRKVGGLGLSDRIWKNTQQFKHELEMALEVGINNGQSAQQLAKSIQQYLVDPNKLFRRVRDINGELRLSKAAKAYNPGQGKYRSSYKNAMRLTRNEINFSYEKANTEKRKKMDFIVGVRIETSPSHNPTDDKGGISCSSLQGNYPADFDFTYKWHVNCKCVSFNILKTREELAEDTKKMLKGGEPNTPSVNEVYVTPENYNQFLQENHDKFSRYKTYPRTFQLNK